jgi:hypothetical protein
MFQRKISPPSSGLKSKSNKNTVETPGSLWDTQCYSPGDNLLTISHFLQKINNNTSGLLCETSEGKYLFTCNNTATQILILGLVSRKNCTQNILTYKTLRLLFSGLWCHVMLKMGTSVSEKHAAPTFTSLAHVECGKDVVNLYRQVTRKAFT